MNKEILFVRAKNEGDRLLFKRFMAVSTQDPAVDQLKSEWSLSIEKALFHDESLKKDVLLPSDESWLTIETDGNTFNVLNSDPKLKNVPTIIKRGN